VKTSALNLTEKEYMLPGNRVCPGCALSLAYRTDLTVVAIAGDGGTYDIGIQALSGAAERQTDFIYICYDNEGYMNTGNQRSGSTPLGAVSGTTPILGKQQSSKDMVAIMEAHGVPYVATANASYPLDLYDKVCKAMTMKGTRFIHVFTPCPPGWRFDLSDTIRMGELAAQTGWNVMYEVEDGDFRLSAATESIARKGSLRPVQDFIAEQGRFKNLTDEQVNELQARVDARWQRLLERAAKQQ